jgi:hypothetical protein
MCIRFLPDDNSIISNAVSLHMMSQSRALTVIPHSRLFECGNVINRAYPQLHLMRTIASRTLLGINPRWVKASVSAWGRNRMRRETVAYFNTFNSENEICVSQIQFLMLWMCFLFDNVGKNKSLVSYWDISWQIISSFYHDGYHGEAPRNIS